MTEDMGTRIGAAKGYRSGKAGKQPQQKRMAGFPNDF
jgi:hypothetical protein